MSDFNARKFQDDVMSDVTEAAKQLLRGEMFPVECPHCGKSVTIPAGESLCPECKAELKLNLVFDF